MGPDELGLENLRALYAAVPRLLPELSGVEADLDKFVPHLTVAKYMGASLSEADALEDRIRTRMACLLDTSTPLCFKVGHVSFIERERASPFSETAQFGFQSETVSASNPTPSLTKAVHKKDTSSALCPSANGGFVLTLETEMLGSP